MIKSYSGVYGWPAVICTLVVVLHELGEDRPALEKFRGLLAISAENYKHPDFVETLE